MGNRKTGNIEYTRHRTKTNKTINIAQQRERMKNMNPQITRCEHKYS